MCLWFLVLQQEGFLIFFEDYDERLWCHVISWQLIVVQMLNDLNLITVCEVLWLELQNLSYKVLIEKTYLRGVGGRGSKLIFRKKKKPFVCLLSFIGSSELIWPSAIQAWAYLTERNLSVYANSILTSSSCQDFYFLFSSSSMLDQLFNTTSPI